MMRAEPPRLLQIHRETVIPDAEDASEQQLVIDAYRGNARLMEALTGNGRRKAALTTSSTTRTFLGTVFETPDGMRFDVRAAATLADAEAARIADPQSRVLVVRTSWSVPAAEWIAADPAFWRGVEP
jgi:hypothetical protein